MADLNRAFLKMLDTYGRQKLKFSEEHFERRRNRGLDRAAIEQYLFEKKDELVDVVQAENRFGQIRYRAYYKYGRKKILLIVVDAEVGFFKVVTFIIMDKKQQLGAMRDASKYSKIARRLR